MNWPVKTPWHRPIMGVARSELWAPENTHKGNVTCCTGRRFLAVHSAISYLEYLRQCRNNAATLCCTKNCDCESSCVTSPLKARKGGTRPNKYLTHAHWNITRAVAALDSCFALIRDQHCIVLRPINQQSRILSAMGWCTYVTYSVLRTIVLYNNTSLALGVVKFHQCKLSFLLALSSWCFAIENVFKLSTWRFGFILLSFSLLT